MPTRPAFSPDWREGRYFDRWMFVHFASGVAGGFGNVFFGFSVPMTFAVAIAVMVFWEIGEALLGVREVWSNRFIDVGVGCAGVGLALGAATHLTEPGQRIAFIVTLTVALLTSAAGWLAYRRRGRAS